MNVVFYLRKQGPAVPNQKRKIYLRICLGADRAGALTTGEEVAEEDWNPEKQRCKPGKPENRRVNLKLDRITAKLQGIYDRLMASGKQPTARQIKEAMTEKPSDFHAWVEAYVQHQADLAKARLLNPNTLRTYQPKVKHLRAFAPELPVDSVTPAFLRRYEHHLKTVLKAGNNPAARCITFVKSVYRHAINSGLAETSPIEFYTPKRDRVAIPQFLSEQEMERLRTFRTQNNAIRNVQQLFLFQCYTGFAYADLAAFNPETDLKTVRGRKWIMKKRAKSGQLATLPLPEEAEAILTENGGRLHVPTLQAYNRRLKDLAADLDFNARVTTHLARKTFAVRMLNKGLSYEVVAAMLGHTDTRVTQSTYARVSVMRIEDELKAVSM